MVRVILPTAGLLTDFESFQELFSFYGEEGLKDVIRETVLMCDYYEHGMFLGNREMEFAHVDGALHARILREYESSAEAVVNRIRENTNASAVVEFALELIREHVVDMMAAAFGPSCYEISKQKWEWYANDLIVFVNFLDADQEPAPSPRTHYQRPSFADFPRTHRWS